MLGMLFSAAGLGISAYNAFKGRRAAKKAEKEAKRIAAANKKFGYEQAKRIEEQGLSEANIFKNKADVFISQASARRSATGVENVGSSLLAEITSELNANRDFLELQRQAYQNRRTMEQQADLGLEQNMAQIQAASDASKATLIGNIGGLFSDAGGLITEAIDSGLFAPGGQDNALKKGAENYNLSRNPYETNYRSQARLEINPYQSSKAFFKYPSVY